MPAIIIIGGGEPRVKGRGEQDYRESDTGDDRDNDQLMQREDQFSDEAARRHDRGMAQPFGLQRISRSLGRR